MKFKPIPDWNKKNLQCHFCKKTKSVKYSMMIHDPWSDRDDVKEVCVCNRCVLIYCESE